MPITRRTVVEVTTKVKGVPKIKSSYIAHCSDGKGYTIEIIIGTAQEIVDTIKDRRLSYGNVDIIGMTHEGTNYSIIITYIIPT